MKTKRYYFILAVGIGILCVPVFGEVELPRPDERGLLGRANPTLAGIGELYVIVEPHGAEPNEGDLVWKDLDGKVQHKLKEAGIGVKPMSPLPRPELRIDINMLKLPDAQKYVFHIQTSLARMVGLPIERNLHVKTDVWEAGPVMQAVSVQSMPDKVTDVVLEQIETFISCYLMANPNDVPPADANYFGTAPKEQVKPTAETVAAKYNYVASKKSKVFHKADCRWAERILPENLVGYNSREEAIKAGKRPCKRCKP